MSKASQQNSPIINASKGSFLGRLGRDERGNVLAIMTMAIFPLAGLVGGGVDMSRMYLAKSRLQQACDAGALAGRKIMGSGAWDANSNAANTEALSFFDNNFQNRAWGTGVRTRSFTEAAGRVTGAANVVVPMTIMRIFGTASSTIAVNCSAEMRLPNTDVMFVLDTTGSMTGDTSSTDTTDKIVTLRFAVKCFYEELARLDVVDADCGGTAPSGGTGGQVQIRFGFMPYSTNVNVGKLLPTGHIANSWNYQTRSYAGSVNTEWSSWTLQPWPNQPYRIAKNRNCTKSDVDAGNYKYQVITDEHDNYKDCYRQRQWKNGPRWLYSKQLITVSGLKSGTTWPNPSQLVLPIGHFRANKTITWDGCIEEATTVKQATYNPLPAAANDLNIDLVPTTNAGTKWGPALPGLIYARKIVTNLNEIEYDPNTDSDDYMDADQGLYNCPTQASRLAPWATASDFQTYVNDLTTGGNTYHDIGLIWGARFLSPTGIFATENATSGGRGAIERHMIFMTDGDTQTSKYNYAAYGVPWFDRRQTDEDDVPSDNDLDNQVDQRMIGLCEAIKNKNITLHVISFGSGVTAATKTRLRNCSTGPSALPLPGMKDGKKFYDATSSESLNIAFKSIANEIAQLRLTQ